MSTTWVVANSGTGVASVEFRNESTGATETAVLQPETSESFTSEVEYEVVSITSTAPVSVWQFNNSLSTASQDSTLLVPTHAWTDNAVVAAYARGSWTGSQYTVLMDASGQVSGGEGGTQSIGAQDALFIQADDPSVDYTGVELSSTSPMSVIGGHSCSAVITAYCDHLEEVILPWPGLTFVAAPIYEGDVNVPVAFRIIPAVGTTEVTLTGSVQQTVSINKGEFHEVEFDAETFDGLAIQANSPVHVMQYMGASRSPSMATLAPLGSWGGSYVVAGSADREGIMQIITPDDGSVQVNGSTVTNWESDGLGYKVAFVPLPQGTVAKVSGTPMQIMVHGFQAYSSFMHLGGFGRVQ